MAAGYTYWDTAANLINRAAIEVGLDSVSDPYASTDSNFVLMRNLLTSVGEELRLRHDWPQLIRGDSITGDGSETKFALPNGFITIYPRAGWDRTGDLKMRPASMEEWAEIDALGTTVSTETVYIVNGGTATISGDDGYIRFSVAPALNHVVHFRFLSSYWVDNSGTAKAAPTAVADKCRFEPLLLVRGMKLHWLQAKGFDTAAAKADFEMTLDACISSAADSPTLSLLGSPNADRLIDEANAPDTGYGSS